ncbi:hypothetical protein Ae201684P_004740 [Aphanomyces euteiches]|uniref:Cationic amino acid transporter C-terminal domain-containing protein n=1 Tax=Aphanomyces euteiches TaxID=100861 RepID=A0A6G0XD86_9STRA|nr:hypothetical protein Ae201684_005965 [Aphanomyces euteiches]KAH9069043.1 hypothetical protein Ae201684P_004740 [Aphanomyces euteiches]KAH9137564.1 hypothetical protein AeRB84_017766 [Aphanomyces euteiches]
MKHEDVSVKALDAQPGASRSVWLRAFWCKSLGRLQDELHHDVHHRTLSDFDLLMIGIGGTVGSGVFATAGLIARFYAGPSAVLSWILAGLGCILSGAAFMELSGLIPAHGSTYAYSYHALGEYPAVVAGFLLTLEYGIACAGNARAWSSKFAVWLELIFNVQGPAWMKPENTSIDLYACFLMTACVLIVLCGLDIGKRLINAITLTKIAVVLFIIIAGLSKFHPEYMEPFIPPASVSPATGQTVFGWPGIMLGASASFYGYIGYDEVCCLAGEAINPRKNIPRAVLGTVIGAAILSILATLSVVGMQRYQFIDVDESYGEAFKAVGYAWASPIVATGEVLTMPVGILIGFLAQPRVQCAMAKDGLLPPLFGQLDASGNPRVGAAITGVIVIALATFVEFQVLWNFISLGILLAFNMTNLSLLVVRYGHGTQIKLRKTSMRLNLVLALFGLSSFLSALHWQHGAIAPSTSILKDSFETYMGVAGVYVALTFTLVMAACVIVLWFNLPTHFEDEELGDEGKGLFHCPGVPFVPCIAIFFNWLLVVQMPADTVLMMAAWIGIATVVYLGYGLRHGLANTA